MKSVHRPLVWMISSLLMASLAGAQETPQNRGKEKAHKRGKPTPVLIPASEATPEAEAATPQPAPTQQAAPGAAPNQGVVRNIGQQDASRFGQGRDAALDPDPNQPRPNLPRATTPYTSNRPILDVNGVAITSAELNEMVIYYQGFRQNVVDLHLQNAVKALLPLKVMESKYRADLPAMKQRIDAAVSEIKAGTAWVDVVAKYSDDGEAENPEGVYIMGRQRAVQPFDRYSHSGKLNQLVGPFLTVYGYHVLEITKYERGAEAKDDKATVRHILVMYPGLKKMDQDGVEIRPFIKAEVKAAKIKALEAASANLVPNSK